MSGSSIPGADAMQDSLEFIKKMWGGMGVPGMVVPTLSVEEINKKITDLKAVESWLSLNLNMLRTTIQALEVQSATLSALRAMGAVNQPAEDGGEAAANAWTMPSGFPFSFMNAAQDADAAAPPMPKKDEPAAPVAPAAAPDTGAVPPSAGNANAWWDLLQNQFKQAVNSVAATEKAAKSAPAATAKSTVKSGAKAPAKPRSKPAVKKAGGAAAGKTKTAMGKIKPASK
ncbi:PhaM family polyhydroxyalkanoate granule multifunctional regulatory protein [Collimonas pratensis]|uniref:PhaM family polyhydroxyalkanoate granule multifunctional regulatory protein n=1 Tax=Collimonas pratensis TaxID=279113 RepID=UPI0019825D00|nr:PhaM family polyhydroxyalkanoate granule multifunctional regulatory protein [Collimonas pratensis]